MEASHEKHAECSLFDSRFARPSCLSLSQVMYQNSSSLLPFWFHHDRAPLAWPHVASGVASMRRRSVTTLTGWAAWLIRPAGDAVFVFEGPKGLACRDLGRSCFCRCSLQRRWCLRGHGGHGLNVFSRPWRLEQVQ